LKTWELRSTWHDIEFTTSFEASIKLGSSFGLTSAFLKTSSNGRFMLRCAKYSLRRIPIFRQSLSPQSRFLLTAIAANVGIDAKRSGLSQRQAAMNMEELLHEGARKEDDPNPIRAMLPGRMPAQELPSARASRWNAGTVSGTHSEIATSAEVQARLPTMGVMFPVQISR
jgi:hypothetical protein